MGDRLPHNAMNLDLNMVPNDHSHTMSLDDWLLGSMRDVVSQRMRLTGDEQTSKIVKTSEKSREESSFFECNICLDLASEPVVTCCGHLFCWACLYRWLFVHSSDLKECPICKGEVTMKTITPIYTRGNQSRVSKVVDSDTSVKIPSRPQANRIESWRQSLQRSVLIENRPMFDMIRRIDNRFDLTRDTISDNPQEVPSTFLLDRIFTTRGMRRGRDTPDDSVDAVLISPGNTEPGDSIPNLTSAEGFMESYIRDHPSETNQEDIPLIDRHSMSSVAGIIQSESQTAETDSMVSATSRRRCESSSSRVSDVNSGESRSIRRRLQ